MPDQSSDPRAAVIVERCGRPAGAAARPRLTVILDDFSGAVAGYAVNLDASSTLQTGAGMRQAIWRKADPA